MSAAESSQYLKYAETRKLMFPNNFVLTQLGIVFFRHESIKHLVLFSVQISGCNSKLMHLDAYRYRIIPDETPPLVLVVLLRLRGGFSKLERKANSEHDSRCMRSPKKKSEAWQIHDFISPSSELQDFFWEVRGWNNANLLGETKIFPPGALAFMLLTSQASEAKTNTAPVGFSQFCFYIGFYVKLLTAFYDQDAPFKYLHDTTFWC